MEIPRTAREGVRRALTPRGGCAIFGPGCAHISSGPAGRWDPPHHRAAPPLQGGLPVGVGNRALAAMAAAIPALPRGRGLGASGAAHLAARLLSSPPNSQQPAEDAVEEGAELTTPPTGTTATPPQPVVDATTRQQPASLQV